MTEIFDKSNRGEIINLGKRNEYIDFLRGIAVIGVISIHTAFWGGQSYTPEWFRNLTLFLDVPFFFYLSGWASSYRESNIIRTMKSLGGIWLKWIFFIFVLTIGCFISNWMPITFQGIENFRDFCNNCFFHVSFAGFPVVSGSIWFMPYYFEVMFVNSIVLMLIQNSNRAKELERIYMWLLFIKFIWVSYGNYLFGFCDLYILFYSFFWMLGFNRMGNSSSKKCFVFCIIMCMIGFAVTSYIQGLPVYDIQSAKFPPSLKYGFVSLVSIFVTKYIEKYIQNMNHFMIHIGKNAIFYYFAQGVGSSFNYYVIEAVQIDNWFMKWCITFFINVVVTTSIAELLYFLYRIIYNKIVYKLKNIISL